MGRYFKFERPYLQKWNANQFFDHAVTRSIGSSVKLHDECLTNPKSSAAACLNVLGNLSSRPNDLIMFLNQFGLGVTEVMPFPSGENIEGEIYDDKGLVVFEWMGPGKSPINETYGRRGENRTSVDAYVLANIDGRVTQILIEWKFTESYLQPKHTNLFRGLSGIERLRRYSTVLKELRYTAGFPLKMSNEGGLGLYELGYEPLLQLLRMTLLAVKTTPIEFSTNLKVEDYRILYLNHSQNTELIQLPQEIASTFSGDTNEGLTLSDAWSSYVLSSDARSKFVSGYWNESLNEISDPELKDYLVERYQ